MGLNLKKILALSGGIAATVSSGGALAPILIPSILDIASEFAPDGKGDPEKIAAEALEVAQKADLDSWERIKIVKWVEGYRTLMERGIGNLEQTFKGRLYYDFVMWSVDPPEDAWIEGVYEMVSTAVRWQIANGLVPEPAA